MALGLKEQGSCGTTTGPSNFTRPCWATWAAHPPNPSHGRATAHAAAALLRTPLPRKPIRSGQCQLRCHDKLRSSHCQSSAITLKPPAAGGPMDWALVSKGVEGTAQPPEPSYFTRSCGPLGLPTRPTRATAGLLRTPLPRKPIRSGHCPAPLPRLGHRLRRSSRLVPWSLREWKVRRNHRS